jgi:tRNA:m4X modification enzyme
MTKMSTCNYWVSSKNRYCKFAVLPNSEGNFCAVHNTGSGESERIPCPVDPRHMIYKRDTEKHVKKCSKMVQVYFEENQPLRRVGCNLKKTSSSVSDTSTAVILSDSRIGQLTELLDSVETSLLSKIRTHIPEFNLVHENDCITEGGNVPSDELTKHELQNAALLKILQETDLAPQTDSARLYAELGCGKAGLTRWLIDSLPERGSPESVFLLVDCEARRHKKENRKDLMEKVSSSSVVRLRLNLADVDLSQFLNAPPAPTHANSSSLKPGSVEERLQNLKAKIFAIQSRPDWPLPSIVGTAKHLCGAATDLGIRCLHKINSQSRVSMIFATCCHHRCDWSQVAGQCHLTQLGITEALFRELISFAGWATTTSLPKWKRDAGRQVKRTIDLARILWIVENFPTVHSVQYKPYIENSVTPENFVIVVRSSDT